MISAVVLWLLPLLIYHIDHALLSGYCLRVLFLYKNIKYFFILKDIGKAVPVNMYIGVGMVVYFRGKAYQKYTSNLIM